MSGDYDKWVDLVDKETAGAVLSDEQREFVESFATHDALARAERDLIAQLGALDEARLDELHAHRIVTRALNGVQTPADTGNAAPAKSRRRWGPWLVGSLTAAAAMALWIHEQRSDVPAAAVSVSPTAPVAVLKLTGSAKVEGRALTAGAGERLEEGSVLSVTRGVACVDIGADIVSCLEPGSRLRLTQVTGQRRRLDLLEGGVASALKPQSAGSQFSVVAAGVWSTAVGTAFSVELVAPDSVTTAVYEGKVRVGTEARGTVVSALEQGNAETTQLSVRAVERPAASPAWRALRELTGIQLAEPRAALASASPPAAAEAPIGAIAAPRASVRRTLSPPTEQASDALLAPAAPDVSALLEESRALRRDQRWADAAERYRRIVDEFPGSAEAHAVRVSLAELELTRLGQPANALQSFEAYLRSGGPLVMEARLGRIRSLRALGKAEAEAEAIEEFLRLHAKSLETTALRARLDALRSR